MGVFNKEEGIHFQKYFRSSSLNHSENWSNFITCHFTTSSGFSATTILVGTVQTVLLTVKCELHEIEQEAHYSEEILITILTKPNVTGHT